MKNLFFLIIAAGFLIGPTSATAQQSPGQSGNEAFYTPGNFERYIQDYLSAHDTVKLKGVCLNSCIFAKFRVDEAGNVSNVVCNVNTPASVEAYVAEAIMSSSGKWKPKLIDGKAVGSKDYLLPIVVHISGGGCTPKNDAENSTYNMLLFDKNAAVSTGRNNRTHVVPLDCIIFNPIYFVQETHFRGKDKKLKQ